MKKIIVIAFLLSAIVAQAQKLPLTQKDGVSAPAGIKVDGKPTEWAKFEAYNKNNNVYYTVANDADYIYLAVQATDWNAMDKIWYGGITFIVKSADKKSVVPQVAVTYPIIPMRPGSSLSDKVRKFTPTIPETDLGILNKQIIMKNIRVSGLKEFPDSTVSIYNEDGIKAAGLIGTERAYTIEFAIALKYLQPIIGNSGKLNYTVRLNGMNTVPIQLDPVTKQIGPTTNPIFLDFATPTHFSDTYTLAKK